MSLVVPLPTSSAVFGAAHIQQTLGSGFQGTVSRQIIRLSLHLGVVAARLALHRAAIVTRTTLCWDATPLN
ncbi:hypothetical protein GUJ93_ZPchr0013g34472 [Zizania palustris]|uniref:Uncharacterized protein n=1 Tax=Zizania palustris TaxID=103762 RepID=A0A8J5WUT9_ZIZPA|nr:hypothetical protein GUJ93_ZPchr0013g34472 [Zizania palustris]